MALRRVRAYGRSPTRATDRAGPTITLAHCWPTCGGSTSTPEPSSPPAAEVLTRLGDSTRRSGGAGDGRGDATVLLAERRARWRRRRGDPHVGHAAARVAAVGARQGAGTRRAVPGLVAFLDDAAIRWTTMPPSGRCAGSRSAARITTAPRSERGTRVAALCYTLLSRRSWRESSRPRISPSHAPGDREAGTVTLRAISAQQRPQLPRHRRIRPRKLDVRRRAREHVP